MQNAVCNTLPKREGAWITGVNAATLAVARVAGVTARGRAAAVGAAAVGAAAVGAGDADGSRAGDADGSRAARLGARPGASAPVAASTVGHPALAGAQRLAPESP
ncbi:hypothetical protein [Sorangium sp. So ce388]|uniref:hypothetical protein n=1 Tax=Sorangium sp. So ce388 TaxID=3133309 RepID=UPI003F5C9914